MSFIWSMRVAQIQWAFLENVLGLQDHVDWKILKRFMEICDYETHWNPQVQLAPFRPIRRGRFLALLIRRDLRSAMGHLQMGMPTARLQSGLIREVFRFAWPAQHVQSLILTPEKEYIYDEDLFSAASMETSGENGH